MNLIKCYLGRFEGLKIPGETIRKAVVVAVKKEVGADISIEDVEYKNGRVYISAHPVIKQEIFLRHEKIANMVSEMSAGEKPKRIS